MRQLHPVLLCLIHFLFFFFFINYDQPLCWRKIYCIPFALGSDSDHLLSAAAYVTGGNEEHSQLSAASLPSTAHPAGAGKNSQNISSAKRTDCIMLQGWNRTLGIFLLLKSYTKEEKEYRESITKVTWLSIAVGLVLLGLFWLFCFLMKWTSGVISTGKCWEYCCNPLKRKEVLYFFFSRSASPVCFWDGAQGTAKSFHLTTARPFSKHSAVSTWVSLSLVSLKDP